MLGGNGGGVNFGGEFGGLARSKSFFQKTLEVIRGAFLAGFGGVGASNFGVWTASRGWGGGVGRWVIGNVGGALGAVG